MTWATAYVDSLMCAFRIVYPCLTRTRWDGVQSLLGSDGQHPGTSNLISLMPTYYFGSGLTPCVDVYNRSAVML